MRERMGGVGWLGLGLLGLAALGCGGPGPEEERLQLQEAHQLRFTVQPPDGRAAEALQPVVTVEVLDVHGERVRGYEAPVELRLPTRASATNLLGGVTRTQDGRATFPSLTVLHVGAYELEAIGSGLLPARSRTFTISPAGSAPEPGAPAAGDPPPDDPEPGDLEVGGAAP